MIVAAARQHKVATTTITTTSPAKDNDGSSVFLIDATVVQNACAATATSPAPVLLELLLAVLAALMSWLLG